jgi:hypothetical protein
MEPGTKRAELADMVKQGIAPLLLVLPLSFGLQGLQGST